MTRLPTAPLKRRLAALVYELLLTGAVTSIAALAAGIVAIFLNPVSTRLSMLATCLILFYAWWLYFRANWHKKGQTLAMQTWKIGLADKNDTQPPLPQLRLRFIWASIFIVFIPLFAYAGLRHSAQYTAQRRIRRRTHLAHPAWGFALFHPDRQFLYDFLAGTSWWI